MIRLIAPLVLIGALATPQGVQRTPLTAEVTKEILTLAEQARADTVGDGLEAVRVFRRAISDKYRLYRPCELVHGQLYVCDYGPKSWYAEKLATALREGTSLTAIAVRDEIVFVIVPKGETATPPSTLRIEQNEVLPDAVGGPPRHQVVTPFQRTTAAVELKDDDGKFVVRVGSAFHVRVDDFDPSNGALLSWWDGRIIHTVSVSTDTRLR